VQTKIVQESGGNMVYGENDCWSEPNRADDDGRSFVVCAVGEAWPAVTAV
jgi:hypothetical protein